MKKISHPLFLLLALGLIVGAFIKPAQAYASPLRVDVTNDAATLDFPNTITFKATIQSSTDIASIVLEYGTEQLTCGNVVAKAFPDVSPGKTANVEWTWDMRQSASLPPGATLWWHWRVTDTSGAESVTEKKTVIWLDDQFTWQTITDGYVNIHWYTNTRNSFTQSEVDDMMKAANDSLQRNEKSAGLKPDAPIHIYVYENNNDMKESILYEAQWTGGQAQPSYSLIIVGTSRQEIRGTIIHELTHVLIGHLTFSCLGDVPTWLNEGLAVYSEDSLSPFMADPLNQAIKNNKLLSLRLLGGNFSEDYDTAILSYAESYSVVKFMVETYGQEKMNATLVTLRDGTSVDDALIKVYGFDLDGLEDEWRKAINADPLPVSAQPTALATPTYVPTIVPVSGAPLAVTPTPNAIPTSSFNGNPTSPLTGGGGPPIMLTLTLIGCCCLLLIILGITALGFILRAQNRKGG